jgi:hypothetical protein
LANSEVIEREPKFVEKINEIQTEYQDLGDEKFMAKYGTKLD